MSKEKLTAKDEELIDLAQSSTYRDTIEKYIEEAETDYAKSILRDILNDCETEWE